mmetsp:Transcript_96606/g.251832  ORF Transcript_96606/g.251832 Transcript_96606/m.251832 type:complete len:325 (-) Transcript_96606:766-1740(-)
MRLRVRPVRHHVGGGAGAVEPHRAGRAGGAGAAAAGGRDDLRRLRLRRLRARARLPVQLGLRAPRELLQGLLRGLRARGVRSARLQPREEAARLPVPPRLRARRRLLPGLRGHVPGQGCGRRLAACRGAARQRRPGQRNRHLHHHHGVQQRDDRRGSRRWPAAPGGRLQRPRGGAWRLRALLRGRQPAAHPGVGAAGGELLPPARRLGHPGGARRVPARCRGRHEAVRGRAEGCGPEPPVHRDGGRQLLLDGGAAKVLGRLLGRALRGQRPCQPAVPGALAGVAREPRLRQRRRPRVLPLRGAAVQRPRAALRVDAAQPGQEPE